MENYSAIKRNKVLIHATIWMNLETIKLKGKKKKVTNTLYNSTEYMVKRPHTA